MLLVVIAIFVLLVVLVIRAGYVPPPYAGTLIRVRNGAVDVSRGHVRSAARQYVADILRDAGVSRGYIAVTSEDSVEFSKTIPEGIRQRLRNVLLNQ